MELEFDKSDAHLDIPALEETIGELVEGFPVQIQIVEQLPATPAGKHRAVISELQAIKRGTATEAESPLGLSPRGAQRTALQPTRPHGVPDVEGTHHAARGPAVQGARAIHE